MAFPSRPRMSVTVRREWLLIALAILHVPQSWDWLWDKALTIEIDRRRPA